MQDSFNDISVANQREREEREARLIQAFLQVLSTEETGNLGWDRMDPKAKEAMLAGEVLHRLERHGADDLWPDQTDEAVASSIRRNVIDAETPSTDDSDRVVALFPQTSKKPRLH